MEPTEKRRQAAALQSARFRKRPLLKTKAAKFREIQ
jgi:hypothetical protein